MLLRNVCFILLVSLAIMVDFGGMSVVGVVKRHDDPRHGPKQPSSSRPGRVGKSRQFRRAFKRSLVQIFGMKTRPQRQAMNADRHVPAYMRWLYEESSVGRLPAVLRRLNRRRRTSSYRQKRYSEATANTVRSFTGTYMQVIHRDGLQISYYSIFVWLNIIRSPELR